MDLVKFHRDMIQELINERLKNTDPAKLVAMTAGTTLALAYLYSQLTDKVRSSKLNLSAIPNLYRSNMAIFR